MFLVDPDHPAADQIRDIIMPRDEAQERA